MTSYRFATVADTEEILAIYRQYIDTSITFEYTLPSVAEFRERIASIARFYPYLVAVEDGNIVGYAYAHAAFERAAYQWDAEFSVYVDRDFVGRGLGRALYRRLIALSRMQGIHIAYGKVTTPNEASDALHLSMGFERLAVFENVGYKNGAWHGVTWYALVLCEFEDAPTPPKSVWELPDGDLRRILGEE